VRQFGLALWAIARVVGGVGAPVLASAPTSTCVGPHIDQRRRTRASAPLLGRIASGGCWRGGSAVAVGRADRRNRSSSEYSIRQSGGDASHNGVYQEKSPGEAPEASQIRPASTGGYLWVARYCVQAAPKTVHQRLEANGRGRRGRQQQCAAGRSRANRRWHKRLQESSVKIAYWMPLSVCNLLRDITLGLAGGDSKQRGGHWLET